MTVYAVSEYVIPATDSGNSDISGYDFFFSDSSVLAESSAFALSFL